MKAFTYNQNDLKVKGHFHSNINELMNFDITLSPPEIKVILTFTDHVLSGVRLFICLSVCKVLTFSKSLPELLANLKKKLAQNFFR